jgi:short subunit dehydrogenase-like uncharacterized protein
VVLLGATGYTGRLAAGALVATGEKPVLAGRGSPRLASLARDLGGLDTAIADVDEPDTVRSLLEPGDVLVSTVGPFIRHGRPAVEAAIDAGAVYLDSCGEPPFIQQIFEHHSPRAERTGTALLPAFAFDSVPGNLAGAVALETAGAGATRVDVGYFMPGDRRGWASGGSRASYVRAAIEPSFVWRSGIRSERGAARVRSFEVAGRRRRAVSAGTTEHFALPRLHPTLREVNTYLGYLPGPARALQALSTLGAAALRMRGVRSMLRTITAPLARASTGGPDARTRARTGSEVVAVAYDEDGRELSSVRFAGAINSYELSARILAFGARRALKQGIPRAGAVGPVEAFGLRALEEGCGEAGMTRR